MSNASGQRSSTSAKETTMRKGLFVVVLVGLVASALAGLAQAQSVQNGLLNCGSDDCADIWKFKCPAANTKTVYALVCPAAAGSQTWFNVTIVGKTPDSVLGKGDIDEGGYEACAGYVALTRPTPGTTTGYIPVSHWNINEAKGYQLYAYCYDKNGFPTTNPSLTLPTNQ